ncbi:MAG: hypothetical protein JRI68_10115 [Deltaproteobacteria bacterium]|nr:hypothetical protein [Deltaproteobacteria bacterium]
MEWIAIATAALLGPWVVYRLWQRSAAASPGEAVVSALRKAQHETIAEQVERALDEAQAAKLAALDYLEAHTPPDLKPAVHPLRHPGASHGTILMGVAKLERQVDGGGYLHVRHHLRKVLLPSEKVLLLATAYATAASDEREDELVRATAGLRRACEQLHTLVS